MRRETPEIQQHQCSGTGTRVEVHRSRHELERVLHKYGADEVLFVEADANAAIQFAMHGRYVQLTLPLPDPHDSRFTHTASGKVRTTTAHERAYDQALREHWRSLVVAVRGKLQSVESGISTFDQEFDRFLVPHFADEKKKRTRKTPKAVNWLLGGSHSLAIALIAAFLVPASAVGAYALPTNVVGNLAAPFRSAVSDPAAAGQGGRGLALARGGWSAEGGNAASAPGAADRLLTLRTHFAGDTASQVRLEASLASPPVDEAPASAPQPQLASASAPAAITPPTPPPPATPPSRPSPPAPPTSEEPKTSPAPPPPSVGDTPSSAPADSGSESSDPAPVTGDQPVPPATDPSSDSSSDSAPTDAPVDTGVDATTPPSTGTNAAPGNGNGNGNGNGKGNGNGNGGTPPGQGGTPPGQGGTPPGQGGTQPGNGATPPGQGGTPPGQGGTPPGQSTPPPGQGTTPPGNGNGNGNGNASGNGNGNGNGNANGQNGTQGQGNGQKPGGEAKGGK